MKVMKFGGSSVANGSAMKKVAEIVAEEAKTSQIALVLSAMKGVTDKLVEASESAQSGDENHKEISKLIREKHIQTAQELLPPQAQSAAIADIQYSINELEDILHGIELIKECSPRSKDLILAFGERLSCKIFSRYLSSMGINASYLDARELIITDSNFGSANVDFEETNKRLQTMITRVEGFPVIPGFIGSNHDGITTTLGRNGSDYTASIVAAGINAESVEIWTDVDGMMTADPKIVPNAKVIPNVSYQEAMEMAYFGAKCVYPLCLVPVVEKDIPMLIKNTHNPSALGTLIHNKTNRNGKMITGIASIPDITLLNIQGGGMMGMPGFAARIFSALAKTGVNIVMITQASSEHSICLAFKDKETKKAVNALKHELAYELQAKRIQQIEPEKNLEIIAVIGENMRGIPGIAGILFSALGVAGVNVLAIAQGSSELNVSFIVRKDDAYKAVQTLHRQCLE